MLELSFRLEGRRCVVSACVLFVCALSTALFADERAEIYREIAERFERLADIEDSEPTPDPDPTPDPEPTPDPPTGNAQGVWINIPSAHSWDDITIFRNAFMETRWVTEYRGTQYVQDIPVDETGWPSVSIPYEGMRLFGSVEINADLPIVGDGAFTLVQNGPSVIEIAGVGNFENIAQGAKHTKVTFPPGTEKVNVAIRSANRGSRWQLIYPGEELYSSRFHSAFLRDIRRFGGIRFMDWQRTNGSTQKTWADSNKPTGMSESSDTGSSWLAAIELANETGCDMWISIPHGVDSEYTKTLARLIESTFKGDRIVLEYSNECWNYSRAFRPQLDFCRQRGRNLKPSETDDIKLMVTGYADLADKHFAAFRNAYGGRAAVDYVIAWQSTANWSPKLAMDLSKEATAVAHAPYIFVSGSGWKSDSVGSVFGQLNIEGLERCRNDIAKWKGWADERDLKYMIYECGHHVGGSDHTFQITHDSRMTKLITDFDALLPSGTIRCYFNYGGLPRRNLDFGHQSFSGDYSDPKWKALEILTEPKETAQRREIDIAEQSLSISL